jgi:hypothetical protein
MLQQVVVVDVMTKIGIGLRGQTPGSKEACNWCHDSKTVSDGCFVGDSSIKKYAW